MRITWTQHCKLYRMFRNRFSDLEDRIRRLLAKAADFAQLVKLLEG